MNVEFDLVRAYFEQNGFWVRLHEFSFELGKKITPFPYFEIFNPTNSPENQTESFRIFTGDLPKFSSAIVSLIGWNNTGFSSDMLTSDVRIMKFFRKQIEAFKILLNENVVLSLREGKKFFLILPAIPKSDAKTKELFDLFKENGVNGVLTMSSLLENLLRKSSEIRQPLGNSSFYLLKLLKAYGLATEPQLNIFD